MKYLTDQFGRMWTRFNFFLTVETALIGGKFFLHGGQLSRQLAIVGAAISAVWYVFGAEDRYLVRIYRHHVEEAARGIVAALSGTDPSWKAAYRSVGETDQTAIDLHEQDRRQPALRRLLEHVTGWRLDLISTTRLAAWFPLLTFWVWVGLIASSGTP